jgi:hypothetical protein
MSLKRRSDPPEFYIGYLSRSGNEYKKFVRLVIFALLVISYITASFIVSNQRGFSNGIYERDQFTELEGVVMLKPFAAIKTFYGKDIYGNPVVKTIPLVNYGKAGADAIVQSIAEKNHAELDELWVKLRGKLIYKQGAVIIELSEKENSILTVSKISKEQLNSIPATQTRDLDSVTLSGQIVDPKCFLGVMKPGEGKPHSDCAIRCIAGGIQPLLMIRDSSGAETYFVLRDEDDNPVNEAVLPFVGQPVSVTGNLFSIDDWLVLKINPATAIKKI